MANGCEREMCVQGWKAEISDKSPDTLKLGPRVVDLNAEKFAVRVSYRYGMEDRVWRIGVTRVNRGHGKNCQYRPGVKNC